MVFKGVFQLRCPESQESPPWKDIGWRSAPAFKIVLKNLKVWNWLVYTTKLELIFSKMPEAQPLRLLQSELKHALPENNLCIFEISYAISFWIWEKSRISVSSSAIP